MRRALILLSFAWLLLAPRGARCQEDAKVPCYTCRTDECPSLDAPLCEKKPSRPRPVRPVAPRPPRTDTTPTGAAKTEPAQTEPAQTEPAAPPAAAAAGTSQTPPAAPAVAPKPTLVLTPTAQPAPLPTAPSSSRLRRWKWLTLGAGLVLAGVGGALIGIDHGYGSDCWMPGDISTCKQVLSSQPAGIAVASLGGVALVGAVTLFVLDARGEKAGPRLAWWTPRLP